MRIPDIQWRYAVFIPLRLRFGRSRAAWHRRGFRPRRRLIVTIARDAGAWHRRRAPGVLPPLTERSDRRRQGFFTTSLPGRVPRRVFLQRSARRRAGHRARFPGRASRGARRTGRRSAPRRAGPACRQRAGLILGRAWSLGSGCDRFAAPDFDHAPSFALGFLERRVAERGINGIGTAPYRAAHSGLPDSTPPRRARFNQILCRFDHDLPPYRPGEGNGPWLQRVTFTVTGPGAEPDLLNGVARIDAVTGDAASRDDPFRLMAQAMEGETPRLRARRTRRPRSPRRTCPPRPGARARRARRAREPSRPP